MKGLGNDVILNYRSRYNCGMVFMGDLDERIHLAIDREIDDVRNIPIAKNQMEWFLLNAEKRIEPSESSNSFVNVLELIRNFGFRECFTREKISKS